LYHRPTETLDLLLGTFDLSRDKSGLRYCTVIVWHSSSNNTVRQGNTDSYLNHCTRQNQSPHPLLHWWLMTDDVPFPFIFTRGSMSVRPFSLRWFTVGTYRYIKCTVLVHVRASRIGWRNRKPKTQNKPKMFHQPWAMTEHVVQLPTTCIQERTVSFFNYIVSCSKN
jgi:hypothetical protein